MASISVLTTNSEGSCDLTWFDSLAAAIPFVRNFRAANDYADNTGNPASVNVSDGSARRVMFWSAIGGFVGGAA